MSQINIICDAIKEVTKRRSEVFNCLLENNFFGWEKWFQMELGVALTEFGSPSFEESYSYRSNGILPPSKDGKNKAQIDILFKADKYLKNKFVALEIKVNKTSKILKPVRTDLLRLHAVNGFNFRCIAAVLAYGDIEKSTKYEKLIDNLIENKIATLVKIKNHINVNFLVIGWEENLTQNMVKKSYKDWLDKLNKIYDDYDC